MMATMFCGKAQDKDALLFHLSGENGATADYAAGASTPNFISNISLIEDGAEGKALRCELMQTLSYKAAGNIYSRRGTLAFWWRAHMPVGPTEFPIFRVGFADHSSWDMCWLRIDYNGHGFDAFVTDNNLARIRVTTTVEPFPAAEEWTHIAFSWDESNGVKLYLNGAKAAERDTCCVLDTGLDQFGPHSRVIAPYQVQSGYNMRRGGDIDELRIYGQALSDSQIASLANGTPANISEEEHRSLSSLKHYHGFDSATPPYLEDNVTTVRKVGILESYDLKRWWWKGCDGIRETTWPGVYNRSRIEGRTDYFILPDTDCYSNSGWQIRFNMPDEQWNHIEISGSAHGTLAVSRNNDGSDGKEIFRKAHGTQHGFYRLDAAEQGQTIVFTNEVQETPIQEFDAYNVHEGDIKGCVARMTYILSDFTDYNHPQLLGAKAFVEGRNLPERRGMLLGRPLKEKAAQTITDGEDLQPVVHMVIPSDYRDIDINMDKSLESAASVDTWSWMKNSSWDTWRNINGGLDGVRIHIPGLDIDTKDLIPVNIQIKDPVWKMRNMFDFSFSVKKGQERTLWLDMRDRILPDDEPLYLTMTCPAEGFRLSMLKDMRIELIFKDREEAKVEHIADRMAQIRDTYAMLVEEGSRSLRHNKVVQILKDMSDLLRVDPYHKLCRQYWVYFYDEQPGPEYTEPLAPEGMPEWAFVQLELLKKYQGLVEWFIDKRQIENGEFGGGISDDSDLLNMYSGLYYIGTIKEKVKKSLLMFMDAIEREGTLTGGLSTIQTDGLHTYEEGVNTLSQLNLLDSGNPKQAERLMENLRNLRRHVMGINKAGHLHFRSDYFSATEIALEWPWCWTSYRINYHTGPGLILGEFYGNPKAREILLQFADSILEHKRYKDGVIELPLEINYQTDEVRRWGLAYLEPLFCYAYYWTGDARYLEVLQASGFAGQAPSKEDMVRKGREDIRYASDLEYINTEGSLWTDRIGFRYDLIQEARLGGIAMNRTTHLVPLNLVGWTFEDEADAGNVAILIGERSRTGFTVEFYNTSNKAVKVSMDGVQALGGNWELSCVDKKSVVRFGRGRSINLRIPPRKEYKVSMKLVGPAMDFNSLPDLGISRDDVKIDGNCVQVTVHNISGKDVEEMEIALTDAKGRIISRGIVPPIACPSDLMPKTSVVTLQIPEKFKAEGCNVVLDPDNKIEEIYEDNNTVIIKF